MAKCKNCKKLDHILNRGISVGRWCVEKSDSPDIERERICDKFVPMTQGDKIRNMTDEELAEFIGGLGACISNDDEYCYKFKNCNDCRLEWLKSEAGCE